MASIKCIHCEALNRPEFGSCTQCGAPLGRSKTFAIVEDVAPPAVISPYVYGVDVSAWNGTMDWNLTKLLAHFAFIRAGYGDIGKDKKVDVYRNDISLTPMVYGLYWYVKVGMNWKTHVSTFKGIYNQGAGALPPVFDFESTTLSPADTTTWIYNLLAEWEYQTGVKPLFYTSPGWWNAHTVRTPWTVELWDAHWTNQPKPIIPIGWSNWKFWQYSADGNGLGKVYGSLDGDKDMDLDRYNGTLDQFNTEYHLNLKPIEPPVGPDPVVPKKYVVIAANALNMRALPSAQSQDIGTLKYGDDVPVIEESGSWYKIAGWIYAPYTKPK